MDHKSQAAVVTTSHSLSVMAIEPVLKFIFPLILLSSCRPNHVSKTLHTDTTAATSKGNIAVWFPDHLNLSQFHTTIYRSFFHPYMYKIFEIRRVWNQKQPSVIFHASHNEWWFKLWCAWTSCQSLLVCKRLLYIHVCWFYHFRLHLRIPSGTGWKGLGGRICVIV